MVIAQKYNRRFLLGLCLPSFHYGGFDSFGIGVGFDFGSFGVGVGLNGIGVGLGDGGFATGSGGLGVDVGLGNGIFSTDDGASDAGGSSIDGNGSFILAAHIFPLFVYPSGYGGQIGNRTMLVLSLAVIEFFCCYVRPQVVG